MKRFGLAKPSTSPAASASRSSDGRRRREQVGTVAEHAQLDEPLSGLVDQRRSRRREGPERRAVRRRSSASGFDQRVAFGGRRSCGDGRLRSTRPSSASIASPTRCRPSSGRNSASRAHARSRSVSSTVLATVMAASLTRPSRSSAEVGRAKQPLASRAAEHDLGLGHGVLEPRAFAWARARGRGG